METTEGATTCLWGQRVVKFYYHLLSNPSKFLHQQKNKINNIYTLLPVQTCCKAC